MTRLRPAAALGAIAGAVALFYHGLVFQRLIIGDYDAFVYFYPLREYAARVLRQGHFPLWNPFTFMGAPFFANVQTAVLYPPNVVFMFLPTPYAFSVSVVGHVLLAAGGMYLFCRKVLGVARLPGLLGALAFSLGGFISFQVSHINQLSVSAWLPLLLVSFDAAVRRRSLRMAVVTGLIGTLQLLAGHTQEWYFSTATLGLFALWRVLAPLWWATPIRGAGETLMGWAATVKPVRMRLSPPLLAPIAILAVAGVVELGLAAVQWMPTLELSAESIRGGGLQYGEAISFSLPPTTALYTLLPTYPSTLFSEYVGYVGVIPLMLAALAVAGWARKPVTLLMIGLTIFGLVMAFGGYNPAAPLLYRLIPGLNLFRVPARWLLVYSFGISGLAALGLQWLVEGRTILIYAQAVRVRSARGQFGVPVALFGVAAATLGLLGLLARPAPEPGVVLAWCGIALAAVAMWSAGYLVPQLRSGATVLLIAGTAAELWVAGDGAVYRHAVPAAAYSPQRESTSYIADSLKKDAVPERVLSIATDDYEIKETPDYNKQLSWLDPKALTTFLVDLKLGETLAPNVPMELGIQTPDGYDGGVLPLKRYGVLKTLLVPPEGAAPDSLLRNNLQYVPPFRFLDLLGIKYVLSGKVRDAKMENLPYDRGVSVDLRSGDTRTLARVPDIQATSVGLISSTSGARTAPDGTVAGVLAIKDDAGKVYELPVRAGTETGETALDDGTLGLPAHKRPEQVPNRPPSFKDTDYFVKIRLPARVRVKEVTMKGLLPDASLRVRAITLIDDAASAIAALTLSDSLDRQEFFDMRVYEYRDSVPRAFVAYNAAVRADEVALGDLGKGDFSVRETALIAPSRTARGMYRSPGPGYSPDDAKITSYQPDEVVIDASARDDGYLVLLDAFYPGWVATVDGKETSVERADYMFRGVYLGKGQHRVVFRYSPESFQVGGMVTAATVLLLSGPFLLGALGRRQDHVI